MGEVTDAAVLPTSLKGSRAVVTGAAQGIGAGFATVFAQAGADVVLVDREPGVTAVAEELSSTGLQATAHVGDVSDAAFVRATVDAAGPIDILVNNAGEVWQTGPLDEWDAALSDYERLIDSNLKGAFLFGRAVAPVMAEYGGGHIINISSDHIKPAPETGWHHGHGAMDLYNAAKWALNGLTFDWAKALRPHGIRVNNICMGATDTAMLRSWIGKEPDPEYLETWMTPEGIALVALDLIAEGLDGRTGDNIGLWAGHETVLPPNAEGQPVSRGTN